MIPARQIGSANATLKQHIPIKNNLILGHIKADMTRRMTRCIQYLQPQLAHRPSFNMLSGGGGEGKRTPNRAPVIVAFRNISTVLGWA